MKIRERTISVVVIMCFIFNHITFASEVQTNTSTLAPLTRFDRMTGKEFKEAAQIQIGITEALKGIDVLTLANIRTLGERSFSEKTVFSSKVAGIINFDQALEEKLQDENIAAGKDFYIFKARIPGKDGQDDRWYYCLLSKVKTDERHSISVVPETLMRKALKKGTVKFAHGSIDGKDREIVELYTAHEITTSNCEAIDPWIAERMERGEYAVDALTAVIDPLYNNAQKKMSNPAGYDNVLGRIYLYLEQLGVGRENIESIKNVFGGVDRLEGTIILIPYDEGALPAITINGQRVMVTAHSSQFATYILLPRPLYQNISEDKPWNIDVEAIIEKDLIHEIGARCGLKTTIKDGRLWNLLDEAVSSLKEKRRIESIAGLQNLSPVDFLNLELRNDYAAGGIDKKSIFKRIMALVLAGATSILSSCSKPVDKVTQKTEIGQQKEAKRNTEGKSTEMIRESIQEPAVVNNETKPKVSSLTPAQLEKLVREMPPMGPGVVTGNDNESKEEEYGSVSIEEKVRQIFGEARQLNSSSDFYEEEREAIVRKLAKIGNPAVPVLITAVEKSIYPDDFYVIECSIIALGEIRDDRAVDILIKYLEQNYEKKIGNPDTPPFDNFIAEALGKIGNKKAVSILVKLLNKKDTYYYYQNKVVEALGAIGDASAVRPIIRSLDERSGALNLAWTVALGRIGSDEAIEVLVRLLTNGDVGTKSVAAIGLGLARDVRAVKPLVDISLKSSNKEIRGYATNILLSWHERSAIAREYLIAQYGDKYIEVLNAHKLISIGDFDKLLKLYGDIGVDVLIDAISAETLPYVGPLRSCDLFKSHISKYDKSEFLRLIKKFNGKNRAVLLLLYCNSKSVFGWITDTEKEELLEAWGVEEEIAGVFDNKSYIEILNALSDLNPETTLKIIGPVTSPLIRGTVRGTSSASEYVAGFVGDARMLTLMQVSTPVKLLAKNKKLSMSGYVDGRTHFGIRIPPVIWTINDEKQLIKLLSSPYEFFRYAAAKALQEIEEQNVLRNDLAQLLRNIQSDKFDTRYKALYLFGTRNTIPAECVPYLMKVFDENNWWVHQLVEQALVKIGKPAVAPILEMAQHTRWLTRKRAAHALGEMGSAAIEALPVLRSMRDNDNDEAVRKEAGEAINKIEKESVDKAQKANIRDKVNRSGLLDEKGLVREVSDATFDRLWNGESIDTKNPAVDTRINDTTMSVLAMLGVFAFPKPDDSEIEAIAARIKEQEIEVFMPTSLFPKDTLRIFKNGLGRVFGDRLRVYNNLSDLAPMIKNPEKSVVMTVDLNNNEVMAVRDSFNHLKSVRFMNFERIDVEKFIGQGVYENYISDTLSKLLVARAISREEANDESSPYYRLLAHLLSGHMPKKEIGDYINQIVNDGMDPIVKLLNLIKQVLKAMPIEAYKYEQLKTAVQVLWAA